MDQVAITTRALAIALLVGVAVTSACADDTSVAPDGSSLSVSPPAPLDQASVPGGSVHAVELPPPRLDGPLSLEEAIQQRLPEDEILRAVEDLAGLCNRARSGSPD